MKKAYITTSIPYVNDQPHIGHALELVQADTLARFFRKEKNVEIYFLTGTDDNAIKNVEAAQKLGLSTQELVNKNSEAFLKLKNPEALNLSYDQFIKTSSEKHKKGAKKFWETCKKGDIYSRDYEGLYCTGCETFYKDGELENNFCPIHKKELEKVKEKNWFFKLKSYEKSLQNLIEKDEIKIYPEYRKTEILNFIKKGLEDISISRPRERTKSWGIPVPNDVSQIMYVWFDALTNYITALDFESKGELFLKFWLNNENKYHVIGKDIVKFHALYWPAMLLSAGLPLPNKIFVHGFINIEGQKMSKSLGNVIDPFELVEKWGTDAVRYYLLREIPTFDDGDYSEHRMEEVYNSDLANELGNLLSRITQLCEENKVSFVERVNEIPFLAEQGGFSVHMGRFEFNLALEQLWIEIKNLNVEVNKKEPWKLSQDKATPLLKHWLQRIRNIAFALKPFLPETAEKILKSTQGKITKIKPLFPKK